jgi:hypothetical protein
VIALSGKYYKQLWGLLGAGLSTLDVRVVKHACLQLIFVIIVAVLALVSFKLVHSGIRYLEHCSPVKSPKRSLSKKLVVTIAAVLFLAFYCLKPWHLIADTLWVGWLPAFDEALSRGLIGIGAASLVLLAAQVLGAGILRILHWHPGDWSEGLLYRTSVGLGLLSYLSKVLAILGVYHPTNVQLLMYVVLLVGGVWLYQNVTDPDEQKFKTLEPNALTTNRQQGDRTWQAIAILAIVTAFLAALAPEKEYDALWYHLGFPRLWLQQGYLVDLPYEYVSLYPMTWELIFGAGLALGNSVAAKLLHFMCLPLTALMTYQLTLRFVPGCSPWLAVAFFVTVPTVIWEASTAYVDLALAMHVGLVIYALLRYVEERSWQWLALAAINLGVSLATKHLALFVLAIATGGLALRLWFEDRNVWRAILPAALMGLSSLIFPLPWYIRSWLATGNPVFPVLFGVLGGPPERWDTITQLGLDNFFSQFGRPRTVLNLLTLPWDMTVHAARYGGSLGPMFSLLLPFLALPQRFSPTIRWLATFVLAYIVLWTSPLSSFQVRFLVPVTPVLAVLAAEAYNRLTLVTLNCTIKPLRLLIHSALAVLLFLNLPPFTPLHEGDRLGWEGWLTHVVRHLPIPVVIGRVSEKEYLVRHVPSYAAWHYINAHLPLDACILTFSGGDHFYSRRERIWSYAAIVRSAVWAKTGEEQRAFQTLEELGVSHILFDKKELDSLKPETMAIAQSSILANYYSLEYADERFALYRLRWDKISSNGAFEETRWKEDT